MVSGDGIIIITPDNKCIMVDSFDTQARDSLVSFLRELGIKKIDCFIASHNHSDHIGGVPALLENFQIEKYFWNGANFNSEINREINESLIKHQVECQILKEGDLLQFSDDGQCYLEVFWPNLTEDIIHDAYYNPGRTAKLKNNTSLVFKFHYKEFSILFTGDIYKESDRMLVKKYGNKLKSTVLKVPHHGEFYTANSPAFVKTVNPELAVIQDNRYINFIISWIYRKTKLLYRNSPGCIVIQSDGYSYTVTDRYQKQRP